MIYIVANNQFSDPSRQKYRFNQPLTNFIFILVLFGIQLSCAWDAGGLASPIQFNAWGQSTAIDQYKPSFGAAYSGENSIQTLAENSYTGSSTFYFGLGHGNTQIYVDPELFIGEPLSGLHGMGGIPNGELQKGAATILHPEIYLARYYLNQTFNFDTDGDTTPSAANQLPSIHSKDRLSISIGKLSILDLFDNSLISHDSRQQFMNWSSLTYGAWDYAADQRGYTIGMATELFWSDWELRGGRFAMPIHSNGEVLDLDLWHHYGDQFEIVYNYGDTNHTGKVRGLLSHNVANMGSYAQSIAIRPLAPSLDSSRAERTKWTYALGWDQKLSPWLIVNLRASINSGDQEEYCYAEIDRALQVGLELNGLLWHRDQDRLGLMLMADGLSDSHRQYLADGGMGAFLGDGQLNYGTESILEGYYKWKAMPWLSLSGDIQEIWNPGYNRDRGPIWTGALRIHMEY